MPTYDYLCEGSTAKAGGKSAGKPRGCGHRFEHFQSMSSSPLKTCPKCGKNTLKRLIGTGAAVLFKGSGFYETDYRSDSYKKAAEAESKPAEAKNADVKPGDTKSSDTKPAEPVKAAASDAAPAKAEKPAKVGAAKPRGNARKRA